MTTQSDVTCCSVCGVAPTIGAMTTYYPMVWHPAIPCDGANIQAMTLESWNKLHDPRHYSDIQRAEYALELLRNSVISRSVERGYIASLTAIGVLALRGQEGCTCQGCGSLFTVDIKIPDDLWEKIKPEGKPKGGGLLCGQCITQRLEQEGFNAYRLERIK